MHYENFLKKKSKQVYEIKKLCNFKPQTRKDLTDCKPRKKNAKAVLLFKNALVYSFRKSNSMSYFYTSESVSEGHPDKISDQISDALLDNFLAFDPESRVACETMVTTGQVILAGEVKSKTYLDVQTIARNTINSIGYTKSSYQFSGYSCGVISLIHEQSQDINRGVGSELKEKQGA